MQSTTPDSSPQARSLRENIQRLLMEAVTSAAVTLITVSILIAIVLAVTTTPEERMFSYEYGQLSDSIWPVRAWDWSIDRIADLLQGYWLQIIVAILLLLGWRLFTFLRPSNYLPRRQNR